jgi:hypothetical protein
MHELDRIRLALTDAADRGEGAVLATVVAVDGSATSTSTRGRSCQRRNASTLSRSVHSSFAPPAK